jgi:DNA-binding transcriptional MerR regulator
VHELRFIKRARSLGFPIEQIDELLELWRDKKRPSRQVRALAERHMQAVTSRMQAHRAVIRVLGRLITACQGDDRPDCPILDDLSLGDTGRPQDTAPGAFNVGAPRTLPTEWLQDH